MKKSLFILLLASLGISFSACRVMPDEYYSRSKSSSSSYTSSSSYSSSSSSQPSSSSSQSEEPDPSGPTIDIKDPLVYPKETLEAFRGQTVNLKDYLVSEQLEYFVTFKYTFDGYGEMGTGDLGAQPMHIEEEVTVEGWKLLLQYCGTYKVFYSANKSGQRLNNEGAFFLLQSYDMSMPTINNSASITYTVLGDGSTSGPIEDIIECEDIYYKELTKTIVAIDGSTYIPGKSYSDGNVHTITVAVSDGFLNVATKDIKVKFSAAIYQDKNCLKKLNKPYYHDFDDYLGLDESYLASYAEGTYVGEIDAIQGKSMKFTNVNDKCTVQWNKASLPLVVGTYEITFDYKVLSTNMPNYFCVGFYKGSLQKNKDNIFNGVSAKSGTKTLTYSISEAGNYYVQIFQYLKDSSIIVFDNLVIERVA